LQKPKFPYLLTAFESKVTFTVFPINDFNDLETNLTNKKLKYELNNYQTVTEDIIKKICLLACFLGE